MKRLLRIYQKYSITAIVLTIVLIGINLAGFMGLSWVNVLRTGEGGATKRSFRETADRMLVKEPDGYVLTDIGETYLEENQAAFLMLLDRKTGEILYEKDLPEDLDHVYDLGDVASFSRWYLNDHPIRVWDTQDGLLVLGMEKGSAVQFSLSYQRSQIDTLMQWIPAGLLLNLSLILLVILVLGHRFNSILSPIDNGIRQLSRGEVLSLEGKGVLREVAENLNQASDILQEQREKIKRRDTARTEWIAGVSHDIRTPLSMILGYAENLENSGGLSEEERRQARVIKEQSIRIRRLIEDLNLTSRLTYQMQPVRLAPYRPAALLRQTVTGFLNQGLDEKYEIRLELEEGLEQVQKQGDAQLLKRALENLIWNSIRHNPGGCHICVKAWREEKQTVIAAADDGCGIPPEVRSFLMQEEEKGKESRVHIMGLRLVLQIVKAHQGGFFISEDGKEVQMRL